MRETVQNNFISLAVSISFIDVAVSISFIDVYSIFYETMERYRFWLADIFLLQKFEQHQSEINTMAQMEEGFPDHDSGYVSDEESSSSDSSSDENEKRWRMMWSFLWTVDTFYCQ